MEMAERAAVAANKSLELSQDAYGKGLISIVDLIDVQKAAAQSDLSKANSVYELPAGLSANIQGCGDIRFPANRGRKNRSYESVITIHGAQCSRRINKININNPKS